MFRHIIRTTKPYHGNSIIRRFSKESKNSDVSTLKLSGMVVGGLIGFATGVTSKANSDDIVQKSLMTGVCTLAGSSIGGILAEFSPILVPAFVISYLVDFSENSKNK